MVLVCGFGDEDVVCDCDVVEVYGVCCCEVGVVVEGEFEFVH